MPDKRWLVALVALWLSACGPNPNPTPPPPPPPPPPSVSPPPPAPTPGGVIEIPPEPVVDSVTTLGEILAGVTLKQRQQKVLDDAAALGPLLNQFWTTELQTDYSLIFDMPDRFDYYRGASNDACGGVARPLPNNAYYCDPDNDEYIAFDLDWFSQYLIKHPTGATTFLILAHEWGHAVQDTWLEQGGTDTWNPPYRKELNADCLAGVFLEASFRTGTVIEEAGDGDAIFSWLLEGGLSPWTAPDFHGTSQERQEAFSHGYRNGTKACRQDY